MIKKEITIQGKTYPAVFNMQTIMNFEEIYEKSFFGTHLTTMKAQMALIIAAILSADEDSDITIEAIKGKQDMEAVQDIICAFHVVMSLVAVFFDIPDVEPKDEKPAEEQQEGETKN